MAYENVLLPRHGDHATITMNRPQQRNALSLHHHDLDGVAAR